ncbi:hypothetical protein [Lysobacter sp. Root916]|uniref:TRAFAC clade GTPase domain-containing protein n=1 Tax=Lysobacter sp. Root916 TaxID=1736606 RepID=UPI000ACFDFE1|nr:hypothetical protein [Lysobacter sp. Root916]
MRRIIAAGLPASGKSSFIAALTYLLNAKELQTRLTLASLSGDEKHLQALEHEWLGVKPLPRTQRTNEHWGQFNVRDTRTGDTAELLVPDMRGELFEQPATIGGCQRALWESLLDCDGMMLFTNVDRPDDDHMACDMANAVATIVAANSEAVAAPTTVNVDPFQASSMPEESKLVELLQAMNRWPIASKLRRIALVLSAWDVVPVRAQEDPISWLAKHRPMLDQFLESNSDLWDVRVYGVSALGGRLPQDQARLLDVEIAGQRIRIVGADTEAHDLTVILHWLMQSPTTHG